MQTLGGAAVGYRRLRVVAVEHAGRPARRTEERTDLRMLRDGREVKQQIEAYSVRAVDGSLLEVGYRANLGPQPRVVRGVVRGDRLLLETTAAGKLVRSELAWPREAGGYFAGEESLLARPLAPGERRSLRQLVPLLDQLATVDMVARGEESVELPAGSARLLRIEQALVLADGTRLEGVVWCDAAGEVLKSSLAGGGVVAYRATREIAERTDGLRPLDVVQDLVVKIDPPPADLHAARRVEYEIALAGGEAADALAEGPQQQVTRLADGRARVVVTRGDGAAGGGASGRDAPPTAADREASPLVQSDDPRVRALAEQVPAVENDPRATAVALERLVHETVRLKDYSQVFASAAEVARTRQGDCTEHAVLLAALCRARDIPARVALGLVYQAELGGFAWHMWNEVWTGESWQPLDATRGRGGTGAGHLRLAHSSLSGGVVDGGLLQALLSVGRLEIRVARVE